MKNISKILLYGFTILIIFLNLNNVFPQLRNQWIVVDSNDYSVSIHGSRISYIDKNSIVIMANHNFVDTIHGGMIYERIIKGTINGGNSWNTIFSDTTANESWESVAYPSKEKIIITGNKREFIYRGKYQDYYKEYGLIIISNDSGKTWTKTYLDSNSSLEYLSMHDSQYGVVKKTELANYFNTENYKKNDSLLITEDGWNSWKAVPIPYETKGDLMQLICFSENFFRFLGYNDDYKSYLYTTEDGGKNWSISKIPGNIENIKFLNKNTGWAIGRIDSIYRTTDGGQTWSVQRYIEPGLTIVSLCDIDFADKDNGIVVGGSNLIIYTSDAGETWYREYQPSNMQNTAAINRIIYPSIDAAYACMDNNYIIKRTKNKILKAPTINKKIFANPVPIAGNILEWDKIEGATHYELVTFFCSRDSFISKFQYLSNIVVSDTCLLLDTLEYNMLYQFKIRAFNDSISSEWNKRDETLKTQKSDSILSCPIILYPEPYSDFLFPSSFTMRWSSREKVDSFELILYEIDVETDNYIILIRENNLKDTIYNVEFLSEKKAYTLSLRSNRNDSLSEWAYSYFRTNPITDVQEPIKTKQENIIKQIIPNPVSDRCLIKFSDNSFNISCLKLYNSMGVEIADLTSAVQLLYGKKEMELNLSSLNSGVYFVAVQSQQNIYSKSFVVLR